MVIDEYKGAKLYYWVSYSPFGQSCIARNRYKIQFNEGDVGELTYDIEHELEYGVELEHGTNVEKDEAIKIARALIDKHINSVKNLEAEFFRLKSADRPDWYVESKNWKFEEDEDDK